MYVKAELKNVKVGTFVKLVPTGRFYERRPADRETGRFELRRADGLGGPVWHRGDRKVYLSINK